MRKLRHRHRSHPISTAEAEKECRFPDLKIGRLESQNFLIEEAKANLKPNQEVEIMNPLATAFPPLVCLFALSILVSVPYTIPPPTPKSYFYKKKNI